MSIEQNKALVRRALEVGNAQDYAAFDEVLSPELAPLWRDGIRWIHATHEAFRSDLVDMVAEDDKVMVRCLVHGTHVGQWEAIPPTGKQWTMKVVLYYRIANGKIVEMDLVEDNLGLVKQLGGTVTPPA